MQIEQEKNPLNTTDLALIPDVLEKFNKKDHQNQTVLSIASNTQNASSALLKEFIKTNQNNLNLSSPISDFFNQEYQLQQTEQTHKSRNNNCGCCRLY